jgi:hypothetical protein
VETRPNSGARKQGSEVKAGLEFLPDSPEQIIDSMKRLGPLRDQLYEVFQEAIGRVNTGQQESDRPAINEIRKRDSEDETPWKEAEH